MSVDRYYDESAVSNYNDPLISEAPYLYFGGKKFVSLPTEGDELDETDDDYESDDDDTFCFSDDNYAEDERLRSQDA
jgi:hypothetical protein